MVNSGGKMILYSGKYVCGKEVHAHSVKCTTCDKWIQKRCNGVTYRW